MPRAIGFAYFSALQTQTWQSRPTSSPSTKRARWPSISRDCRNCLRSSEQVNRALVSAWKSRSRAGMMRLPCALVWIRVGHCRGDPVVARFAHLVCPATGRPQGSPLLGYHARVFHARPARPLAAAILCLRSARLSQVARRGSPPIGVAPDGFSRPPRAAAAASGQAQNKSPCPH